jgi:hypothetical protein
MTNKQIENEFAEIKAQLKELLGMQRDSQRTETSATQSRRWQDLTWDEIKEIVANGENLSVNFDGSKEIELYTGEKVDVVCYENVEGSTKFACVMDGLWRMNDTATNGGGYEASRMATVYVPRFKKLMPADMQDFNFELPEYDDLHDNPFLLDLIQNHREISYWWWTTKPSGCGDFSLVYIYGGGSDFSADSGSGVVLCFAIQNQ